METYKAIMKKTDFL